MRWIYRVILMSILTAQIGCGPAVLQASDDRLIGFLNEFKADAAARGITLDELNYLSIKVIPDAEFPADLGVCAIETGDGLDGLPIHRRWIGIMNSDLRQEEFVLRAVVYHELGHCILSLVHDNRFVDVAINNPNMVYYGQIPVTIMHATFFTDDELPIAKLYWGQYVDELFGITPNPFTDTRP